MKAFKTEIRGAPGGYYMNTSASKARYRVYLDARDVGYDVSLVDIGIRRAPSFDWVADRCDAPRSYSLEAMYWVLRNETNRPGGHEER